MENFDLLALQHDLVKRMDRTTIRKVLPSAPPDHAGILLRLDGGKTPWLLISPGPLYPCILPLAEAPGADRPAPSPFLMLLRKHLEGSRITSLRKVRLERIFLLAAEKTMAGGGRTPVTLVVELTGKSAVIALINKDGNLLGANRQPAGRLLPGAPYSPPRRAPGREKLDPFAAGPGGEQRNQLEQYLGESLERFGPDKDRKGLYRSLIASLEGFGPVYASELAARLLPTAGDRMAALAAWDRFLDQLRELQKPGRHPGHLHRPDDPALAAPVAAAIPLKASRLTGRWAVEEFPALAEADARCREELLASAGLEQRRRDLLRGLSRAAKKNRKLRAGLEADQARFKTAEHFQHYGELLTGALDTFSGDRKKRGLDRIRVEDFFKPGAPEVEIRLNPKLTLVQNVQSFFRRHRRAQRGLEQVAERLTPLRQEEQHIAELSSAAELAESIGDLQAVEEDAQRAKLIAPPKPRGSSSRSSTEPGGITGVLTYRSADGLEILVGKSSRGNDTVTFRMAHPEDFWLHAGGMPGSHVVVRNPQRLEKLPPRTLEQAAGLAAWYSKGRRSTSVDIHLTRRKWVKKPKGGPPGLATLKRFETVLARPLSPEKLQPAEG